MKCTACPKGPGQIKPASVLKSLKQVICLIFKDKNPDIFYVCICGWEGSNKRAISISTDHWLK